MSLVKLRVGRLEQLANQTTLLKHTHSDNNITHSTIRSSQSLLDSKTNSMDCTNNSLALTLITFLDINWLNLNFM